MRPSSLEQESADQDATLAKFVTQHARPLTAGDLSGYDPLFNMIGKARIVMIGDASHGTHEFYRERALITKRLIEERGYTVVGLEVAKWPDVLPLNRYVQGGTGTAQAALGALGIWSSWLWGNRDMQHFLAWLRRHNDSLPSGQQKVSFFGMDVVNGFPAVDQVLQYLDGVNPLLAQRARERYSCLEMAPRGRLLRPAMVVAQASRTPARIRPLRYCRIFKTSATTCCGSEIRRATLTR